MSLPAKKGRGERMRVSMVDFGTLLLTRERGKEVAEKLPRAPQLTLDFAGVEVASPSFLDEIVRQAFSRGAHSIAFVNASQRIAESVQRLARLHEQPELELV